MKFAVKLTVLFSVIFLTVGIVLTYFIYTSNVKTLDSQVRDDLEDKAFHVMDKIDRMMFEKSAAIRFLATDPVITSRASSPELILKRLKEFQKEFKVYESISFFNMNRIRVADTSGIYVRKQRQFVEYWKDIEEGKDFVINIHKSITLKKAVFHFVKVVRDRNNAAVGVVVSRMPVETLYDIVKQASGINENKEKITIDLIDKNGLIIYSSYNPKGILSETFPNFELIKQTSKTKKFWTEVHMHRGEKHLSTHARQYGYLDYKGSGWILIMHIPEKDAFAPATELRQKIIFLSLFLCVIGLFIIYLFSRRLSQPIADLSAAAVEVSKGNLDVKVDVATKDEIGGLAKKFNDMVADLRKYENRLISYSSELEARVAERTAELSSAHEKLSLFIGSLPVVVYTLKAYGDHAATYISGNITSLTGYSPEEFISTPSFWTDRIHPEDRPRVLKELREVFSSDVHSYEYRWRIADGSYMWIHDSMNLVRKQNNEPDHIAGIWLNATKRKQTETELHNSRKLLERLVEERTAELKETYEKLKNDIEERRKLEEQLRQSQKMEAIGTFAGGIAHDFNNILTAIIGYTTLVRDKVKADKDTKAYAENILASAERATKLTQSLLVLGQKHITNLAPVDLNEMVKNVEQILSRLIPEDIQMKTTLAQGNIFVMADEGQMEQVLINLVLNSRDAMSEGYCGPEGKMLVIGTAIVELDKKFIKANEFGKPGRYALLSIEDTGKGMDKDTRQRIFEPFFTTKEEGRGTGLGLSIVYGIVRQHEGSITVYSEPGQGTTFKIYLPLISEVVEKKKPSQLSFPIGGSETILVAEDDAGVRQLILKVLEGSGYNVILAEDGEEAVQRFMENRETIELLVLDVVMPKISGNDALEAIQKMKPGIKSIFMSGYPADVIHKKGILQKNLNFISKPISPAELLKKVREVLDKKK